MRAKEFVDGIREAVLEASVFDTIAVVGKPPGRKPARELSETSAWFNALSETEQSMAKQLLEICARQAVLGLLAVLDGSRQIESSNPSGHFELRYVQDRTVDVLSGPAGEVLHELL